MKKEYIKPEVDVIELLLEQNLLNPGSMQGEGDGDLGGETPGVGGGVGEGDIN